MKTLLKLQINPIHRDLMIAMATGFTMAVMIVAAAISFIG